VFDRYSEKSRRCVFFARYEASNFGASRMEPEHLLLGVVREGSDFLLTFLSGEAGLTSLRAGVEAAIPRKPRTSEAIDMPISGSLARVFRDAAKAAGRGGEVRIEHLLAGLLRQTSTAAARVLVAHGITLEKLALNGRNPRG